jgi:hypothetical protein
LKDDECNDVDAVAKTGYNDAEDNVGDPGDDPSIDTGDAETEVEVSNTANSNVFNTGDAVPTPPPWEDEMDGNMSWFMWLLFGHTS